MKAWPNWKLRLARLRKGDLIAGALLLFSVTLALLHYTQTLNALRQRARAQFDAEARHAHQQLLRGFDAKTQTLRSLVALFKASKEMSAERFSTFAEHQLELNPGTSLCWADSEGGLRFSYPKGAATKVLCRHFDVLEPSKIVDGTPVRFIVSRFAQVGRRGPRGFASVVFDPGGMPAEEALGINEHLLLNDAAQNTLKTYDIRSGQLIETPKLAGDGRDRYFELPALGTASCLYVASPRAGSSLQTQDASLLLIILLVLCLVTSLYLRGLLVNRESIALEVAQRTDELTQFAYRTSHDLRGPLVTIAGLCRAVVEDLEEGETDDLEVNLERIEGQVRRLDRLVGDILDLSRADLSDHPSEPVELNELCAEVIQHVNTTCSNMSVETRSTVVAPRKLHLPRARIFQMLENLLSNSVKYSDPSKPGESYAIIDIAVDDSSLLMVVRDNGIGIPSEYHGRLFKMFERFHPSGSQVGSGLGMSIAKRHVDRLGGEVTVQSDAGGTAVTVRLPLPREV